MDNLKLIDIAIKALEELRDTKVDKTVLDLTEVETGKFMLEISVYHQEKEQLTAEDPDEKVKYMG